MTMCVKISLCDENIALADVASWSRSSGWHWLEHFPHQFPWSGLSVPGFSMDFGQLRTAKKVRVVSLERSQSMAIHGWGCRWHWCWFLWTICWSNRKGTAGAIWRMRNVLKHAVKHAETAGNWQELSDLLKVSETKIFWDIYVSKLEPSISHSFLRSFAIGVLLSQLSASGVFLSFGDSDVSLNCFVLVILVSLSLLWYFQSIFNSG